MIKIWPSKYDFRNYSVLWLKWTQTMEMKQNRHFSMENNQIWHHFSLVAKFENISITVIVGTFQFHCKSEYKQVKQNKITRDMCNSGSIFSYLQSGTLFRWIFKFISWKGLSKKWMIMVPEQQCPSFIFHSANFKGNWTHLAEKNLQSGAKINAISRLSWKSLNSIIIKAFLKHLVWFEHQNHVMLFKFFKQ